VVVRLLVNHDKGCIFSVVCTSAVVGSVLMMVDSVVGISVPAVSPRFDCVVNSGSTVSVHTCDTGCKVDFFVV
jgi:hypothetical protein